MGVKVVYQNDTLDEIEPSLLDELISSHKIKRFLRSEGWASVATSRLRGQGGTYAGPERRVIPAPVLRKMPAPVMGEHFRLLFETMLQGVVYINRNEDVILMNPAAEKILGKTHEEIMTGFYEDAEHKPLREDGSPVPPDEHPSVIALRSGREVKDAIMAVYNPREKEYRWLIVSAVPLFRQGEAAPYLVYILFHDVTSRKRATEELRMRDELLRFASSAADIGTWQWDVVNNEFIWNDRCRELFGFPADQPITYKAFLKTIHPEDRVVIEEAIHNALKEKVEFYFEMRIVLPEGKLRWVMSKGRWLYDERGEPVRMHGVAMDITIHKKAEEELIKTQKLESLGLLAGGIAHNFNNILTAILGNISLARITSADKIQERLADAEKAALRAKDLTQQLLTFSKGGAPVKKTISAAEMIRDSVALSCAGRKSLCDVSIADNLWHIDADEGQMHQAINNLIINADHAMPEGGKISIRCENATSAEIDSLPLKRGKYIRISLHDQGVGIPEENIHKIFDPYFTTKDKGSGLGLASTYLIIKNHGGHIAVISSEGEGTTFIIYLPASESEITASKFENARIKSGKGKILIMDDEDSIRHVSSDMLRHLGYEVESAKNGDEVIAAYSGALSSGHPFDAVILDLTISGGMGGKEAVTRLREIDPNVKAIVSSGYSNDPVIANYKDYGFSGMIIKPYRVSDLSEKIGKITGKK